jgi:SAM-dependent methyltransferase
VKDEFAKQAAAYAKHRPHYPKELIEFASGLAAGKGLAWDAATGSGQVAVALAEHFESVYASDGSAKQLDQAQHHPRVRYAVEAAEACSLGDGSVDLVTCAQALHWLKHDEFFAQVRRVLKPDGVFVTWTYWECRFNSAEMTRLLDRFMKVELRSYWAPEVGLRMEGNRGISIPLTPVPCPAFAMRVEWDLSAFLGYLRSWSAVQHFIDKNGEDPLVELRARLEPLWGPPAARRDVEWGLDVRAGRP